MFCVCERSRAASTSSRIYRGAGLNSSNDKIRDNATSDLTTETPTTTTTTVVVVVAIA